MIKSIYNDTNMMIIIIIIIMIMIRNTIMKILGL